VVVFRTHLQQIHQFGPTVFLPKHPQQMVKGKDEDETAHHVGVAHEGHPINGFVDGLDAETVA
jgi:hypothetical protein